MADHTVLVFYCGHGNYGTDGNYYLTTHDSQAANGKVLPGTGISELELVDKLRAIRAKKLLLLLNACYSGEVSPDLALGEVEESLDDGTLPANVTEALLGTGEGRVIITACRPQQRSKIGTGKLTIFTQALVDGLSARGQVVNRNGYISAFDLYEHMYFAIKEAAGKLGYTQEAELTVLRGVGPFPVSLYHGATNLGAFDAQEPLPTGTAARAVEPAKASAYFRNLSASEK